MLIRRLEPSDRDIAADACRTFGFSGELQPDAFLDDPHCHLFIAEEAHRVLGWVYGHELLHPDGERTMLLYSLDVAPRARRRGLGRALTEAFVAHARAQGAAEVWVLTEADNAAGLATYASAGGRRDPVEPVMFTWPSRPSPHS
jgi:ribosomal protein S18 acetylase RimI-like enzyme